MSVNDVWQLSVIGTNAGQQHIHTLHFREQGAENTGAQLAAAWLASSSATYRGCFQIGQNPVQMVRAAKVCGNVPLPAPHEHVPVIGDQAGTRPSGSSELMPSFISALVKEKSDTAGRRYNGRFFLGGMFESDCVVNDLTAGYLTVLGAYTSALTAAFITPTTPPWRLFCFSRLLAQGRAANTPGQPPEAVAAVQCQFAGANVLNLVISNRPTTMRSRKLGHGI